MGTSFGRTALAAGTSALIALSGLAALPQAAAAIDEGDCGAIPGNVIAGNCGFEMGSSDGWSFVPESGSSSVVSGNPAAHSGSYGYYSNGSGQLTRTVSVAAGFYVAEIWYYSASGATGSGALRAHVDADLDEWDFANVTYSGDGVWHKGKAIFQAVGAGSVTINIGWLAATDGFWLIDDVAVYPATPPTVTTQPTNASATQGTDVSFTAAATGDPAPTVHWEVRTSLNVDWADLPGATSTTLNLDNVTYGMNSYRYRAVFDNGTGAVYSNVAQLFVGDRPTITVASALSSKGYITMTLGATGDPSAITFSCWFGEKAVSPLPCANGDKVKSSAKVVYVEAHNVVGWSPVSTVTVTKR